MGRASCRIDIEVSQGGPEKNHQFIKFKTRESFMSRKNGQT